MSDMANAIMDAAERRMRLGGYGGFSFRDIAAEVGIKSASVHYHFPTKEDLAAAVVHRYSDSIAQQIDEALEQEPDPVKVWTQAFRATLHSEARMCPAAVVGAARHDMPPRVVAEVERYFQMHLGKLAAAGVATERAEKLLATLTGAVVVATAIGDLTAYDRATTALTKAPKSATA